MHRYGSLLNTTPVSSYPPRNCSCLTFTLQHAQRNSGPVIFVCASRTLASSYTDIIGGHLQSAFDPFSVTADRLRSEHCHLSSELSPLAAVQFTTSAHLLYLMSIVSFHMPEEKIPESLSLFPSYTCCMHLAGGAVLALVFHLLFLSLFPPSGFCVPLVACRLLCPCFSLITHRDPDSHTHTTVLECPPTPVCLIYHPHFSAALPHCLISHA